MCDKRTYSTAKQAATNLHSIQRKAKKRHPQRTYYCPVCKGFHLTSQRQKPNANR